MPYVSAYEDLGADVAIEGNDAALQIAKLQLAVNRVIRGGRSDPTLTGGVPFTQATANAATPVQITGVAGRFTMAAFKNAALIAGLSTIGDRIDPVAIAALEQFADSRGYPPDEATVHLEPPKGGLATKVGAGLPLLPEAGVSLTVAAAVVVGAGLLWTVVMRKRGR